MAHSCTPVGQMHRTLETQKNDLVRLLSMTRPLLLPFLPFPSGHRGERENKLFSRLILQSRLIDDEMAHEWAKHVDGIHIFPKLPVHIRIHREEWERNQRIRDALEKNRAGIGRLRELNAATNTRTNAIDAAATSNATVPVNAGTGEQTAWLPPQMPTRMLHVAPTAARSVSAATIVGGTRIGLGSPPDTTTSTNHINRHYIPTPPS
mmetsp:Transcript_10872/g.25657  ORF Transcript_10872/g.25657 Transcript_10872/m.25657 type:complete len:207 (-) Transcript_10872:443-1063(-)